MDRSLSKNRGDPISAADENGVSESREAFHDNDTSRYKKSDGEEDEIVSVEKQFESQEVPPWQNQLTVRAFVVSFALGIMFTFIVMKLNLTTGIIPSLNVSAGLLGFFFVKTWTKFLEKSGLLRQPFTRQENTVIQTCVVATSGIAFSGK
ncbi:OLC1v1010377C1 [Oldenlandia corymbosa var. corymbosa]|uniref:OLC1v1010377C1 n=1 Tax=Oldenlandia corymbosa var. corymbosa TaxID=529605 RepID=A0AAV1DUK1_OLDCO|nr:OLC1v1010377C1 [Oldenlandia corymbosa var. corymbosa]